MPLAAFFSGSDSAHRPHPIRPCPDEGVWGAVDDLERKRARHLRFRSSRARCRDDKAGPVSVPGPQEPHPAVKASHRFDYPRFGEALVERGLIERDVLNHVLQQVGATRSLLPEVLVRENLVSDWEVSRVACEIYHLPFLTVDQYPPSATALDGYDLAYLRHFALVPLDRFGGLVTVIMPGLVPSEVLEGLRPGQGGRVLPVVGSVVSNRRWLEERLAPRAQSPQKGGAPGPRPQAPIPSSAGKLGTPPKPELKLELEPELELASEGDWGNLFDAGDEAVKLGLNKKPRP